MLSPEIKSGNDSETHGCASIFCRWNAESRHSCTQQLRHGVSRSTHTPATHALTRSHTAFAWFVFFLCSRTWHELAPCITFRIKSTLRLIQSVIDKRFFCSLIFISEYCIFKYCLKGPNEVPNGWNSHVISGIIYRRRHSKTSQVIITLR